jgi:hypothetical protein
VFHHRRHSATRICKSSRSGRQLQASTNVSLQEAVNKAIVVYFSNCFSILLPLVSERNRKHDRRKSGGRISMKCVSGCGVPLCKRRSGSWVEATSISALLGQRGSRQVGTVALRKAVNLWTGDQTQQRFTKAEPGHRPSPCPARNHLNPQPFIPQYISGLTSLHFLRKLTSMSLRNKLPLHMPLKTQAHCS